MNRCQFVVSGVRNIFCDGTIIQFSSLDHKNERFIDKMVFSMYFAFTDLIRNIFLLAVLIRESALI